MYSYNTIGKAHMAETWYEFQWLWPRIWQHIKTRTPLWEQIFILFECWMNVYQWNVMYNSICLLSLALSEKWKLCNMWLWVFRKFIAWIALSKFLCCLGNHYKFILSVMILQTNFITWRWRDTSKIISLIIERIWHFFVCLDRDIFRSCLRLDIWLYMRKISIPFGCHGGTKQLETFTIDLL